MSRRLSTFLTLCLLLASSSAGAQADRPVEVFGGGGAARVGGDEGSRGSGAVVLGGFGYRFAPRLSAEVDVMRAQHERDIAGGPLEGSATAVLGNVLYHFGEDTAQFFLMGSLGVLRSRSTHTFPFRGVPTTFTTATDDFAWGGGAGMKVFLQPQLSVRPQFRIIVSEATGVMGLIAGSVALGYHW